MEIKKVQILASKLNHQKKKKKKKKKKFEKTRARVLSKNSTLRYPEI